MAKTSSGMQWVEVSSSNIDAVGYDEENDMLGVRFRGGSVYEYDDVPREEFENLRDAGSVGSYFRENIRERYSYRRVA